MALVVRSDVFDAKCNGSVSHLWFVRESEASRQKDGDK
jgi:hypothetical protein